VLGVWVSEQVSRHSGQKDPSMVVIDEFAGIFISFLAVPATPVNLALGFVLFRLFDIWKPGPIRRLEALPGGWGIMMDDILCGVFVTVLFQIYFFGFQP
jgi:phosphatidylglycerophosphatase A